ncbi:MAG TPA: M23 family metallopeptidase [Puia sp.]|nr:M23 family metallopeptidase [Puia sp.]
MKNLFLLLAALLLLQPSLFSQRTVEVSYIQDTKGNYVFSCSNKAFCTYVLSVEFTTLQNAQSDHSLPYEAEVRPGVNKLFTLSPIKKMEDIQLKYKSSYRKGCLHPSFSPDFTYLLPIAPGKEAQVYEIWNTANNAGSGQIDSSYTIRLKMKPGDTIYAARRGTVSAVDVSNTENDAGATTTGSWNFVEIVHGDCSFGQYGVLKKDGAFVKPGQLVEAGTPIGLVGGDQYGRGSDVRFSVSYYGGQFSAPTPLQFWTKKNGKGRLKHGGTYISEHPPAIIAQEMSKKAPVKKGKGKG